MDDFFDFTELLSPAEQDIRTRVRDFLRAEVEPIANEYWARAEFPFPLIDGFRELDVAGLMYDGLAAHRGTRLLSGFLSLEIAHADPSVNSFYGVHTGPAMGSINRCGSDELGCMMAAYELALEYAQQRVQFGRPIADFQLVQDHLATMLGNVTSSLALVVRLAQLQDEGVTKDEHSALAKSVVTLRMRETVGLAREVLGGNGILLENNVARGRSTS